MDADALRNRLAAERAGGEFVKIDTRLLDIIAATLIEVLYSLRDA